MIDLLKRTFSATSDDNIGLVAAGVAFYGFLAFVPLLAAVVLAYGLFADPADAVGHASRVFQILPDGAARIVVDQMETIADTDASTAGFGLVLALGSAIFGAMKGAKAVIIALNIVTGVEEPRGFLRRNGTALLITVSLSLTALVALGAISLLPLIESLWPGLPDVLALIVRVAFWLLFGLAAAVGVALIYRFGPNAPHHHWRTLLPGALAATGGFLIVTLAFGLFVANFGSYNATYGALGAVVVLLMWLYLSAYVLLFGAELNVELR